VSCVRVLQRALREHPTLRRVARPAYRWSIYLLSEVRRLSSARLARWALSADGVIHVRPDQIRFRTLMRTNKFLDSGRIVGGNWDLEVEPFEDYIYFQSIRDLVLGGRPWQETDLYAHGVELLRRGQYLGGCATLVEWERRGEAIMGLYRSMERNGYQPQDCLESQREHPLLLQDEVSVNIGRNGELLFDDGGHRLCCAKLLGVELIPVRVVLRHKEWEALRRRILSVARREGGRVYQPPQHPDLRNVASWHDETRFAQIQPYLPSPPGMALDIGANWGYFSDRLEELGFSCVAVENDPLHASILSKLKAVHGRAHEVHVGSILDYEPPCQFRLVLALNILHHLVRDPVSYQKLTEFLGRLRTEVMILQVPREDEWGPTSFRRYGPEEFAAFVSQTASLPVVDRIGCSNDGRTLFRLSATERVDA